MPFVVLLDLSGAFNTIGHKLVLVDDTSLCTESEYLKIHSQYKNHSGWKENIPHLMVTS